MFNLEIPDRKLYDQNNETQNSISRTGQGDLYNYIDCFMTGMSDGFAIWSVFNIISTSLAAFSYPFKDVLIQLSVLSTVISIIYLIYWLNNYNKIEYNCFLIGFGVATIWNAISYWKNSKPGPNDDDYSIGEDSNSPCHRLNRFAQKGDTLYVITILSAFKCLSFIPFLFNAFE